MHLNILFSLYLVLFTAAKFWLISRSIHAPAVMYDEMLYRDGAESLFRQLEYVDREGRFIYLYPPLYSIILSPAFLLGRYFYEGMLFINSCLTSVPLLVAWTGLKRQTRPATRIWIVAILSIMPFHWFSAYIMAENALVAMLGVAMLFLYAAPGRRSGRYFWFGAVLGLCYLSKFLFLPLIPIFAAYFLITDSAFKEAAFRQRLAIMLQLAAGLALPAGAWIAFGLLNSQSLPLLFGFGGASTGASSRHGNFARLGVWILYYAEYVLLALPVFVIPLIILLSGRASGIPEKSRRMGLLLLLSLVVMILIAARHSSCAGYNNPMPLRAMGRYVSILFPFLLLPLAAVFEAPLPWRSRLRDMALAAALAACLCASLLHIYLSTGRPFFVNINGIYANHFSDQARGPLFFGATLLAVFVLPFLWRLGSSLLFGSIFAFFIAVSAVEYRLISEFQEPFKLASLVRPFLPSEGSPQIYIHASPAAVDLAEQQKSLAFFDSKLRVPFSLKGSVIAPRKAAADAVFRPITQKDELMNALPRNLIVSPRVLGAFADRASIFGQVFFLYTPNPGGYAGEPPFSEPPALTINDFGPRNTTAGQAFNLTSTGHSAIWFKAGGITPTTVVVFDELRLDSVPQGEALITAAIPSHKLALAGNYSIYLLDTFDLRRSDPVIFEIR